MNHTIRFCAFVVTVSTVCMSSTAALAQYYPNQQYAGNQQFYPNQQYAGNQQFYPNQQYAGNQQYYPNQGYSQSGYGTGFGGQARSFTGGFNGIAQSNGAYGGAQNNTMQQLEQQLNRVDNQQAWSQTPVSMPTQRTRQQPQSMFGRKQVMQAFLGGAPSSGYSPGYSPGSQPVNSGATGQCYSYYQRASNESRKAYNYAQKARYEKDSWVRKNNASYAEYAASAAESAANSAYYAAQSGDAQARGYASQARAAANRARADANRARYNADTIR